VSVVLVVVVSVVCFLRCEMDGQRGGGKWQVGWGWTYQDNGCDGVGAEAGEFGFQLGGFAGDEGGVGLGGVEALAVGVAGGDVVEVRGVEERVEGGAAGVIWTFMSVILVLLAWRCWQVNGGLWLVLGVPERGPTA
jgi:hypothetical protein